MTPVVSLTTGKHQDQWSPTQELDQPNFSSYPDNTAPDAESLIVAMERVTVLFDRQVSVTPDTLRGMSLGFFIVCLLPIMPSFSWGNLVVRRVLIFCTFNYSLTKPWLQLLCGLITWKIGRG